MTGDFGLGFDYTNQRYVTIEEDTLRRRLFSKDTAKLETEARLFWNAVASGPLLSFDNSLDVGSAAVVEQPRLELALSPATWFDLKLASAADARIFHRLLPSLIDTNWQQSTLGNTGRLSLAFRPSSNLTIRTTDELEYGHFLNPDSLNQDHLTNRFDADFELVRTELSSFGLGYSHRRRFSPRLGYVEQSGRLAVDYYFDPGPHYLTTAEIARRTQVGTTPACWDLAADAGLEFGLANNLALTISDELLLVSYDTASPAYGGTAENRLRFEAKMQPNTALNWYAGFEIGHSRSLSGIAEDNFNEPALVVGLDFVETDRASLTLENRLGQRQYLTETTVLATNYLFDNLSLLLDWTITRTSSGALAMTGTLDLGPEWHSEPTDNITTALFSLELSWRY